MSLRRPRLKIKKGCDMCFFTGEMYACEDIYIPCPICNEKNYRKDYNIVIEELNYFFYINSSNFKKFKKQKYQKPIFTRFKINDS